MLKRLDVAIVSVIKDLKEGKFEAGTRVFDVANNGVGITDLKYTKDQIGEENLAKLEEIRQAIISKEIDVQKEVAKYFASTGSYLPKNTSPLSQRKSLGNTNIFDANALPVNFLQREQ